MYGNYCGPYWSGGAFTSSREDVTPGVDALDELCREHDYQYATRGNLKQADLDFSRDAYEHGIRGKLYSVIVGVQGRLRPDDSVTTMPNLRGKNKQQKQTVKNASKNENKQTAVTTAVAPAAMNTIRRMDKPILTTIKNGMILKHKTFISSISGSTTYSAQELKANPGLTGSFPWASRMAARFEKYRFKSLTFHYYSVVATSNAGVVSMSFDYDVMDALPAAKYIQAETTPFVEGNNWSSFSMKVPVDSEWRYIRQGEVATADLKTYDAGKLIIATEYAAGNTVVGELYVDYEMELKNPTEATALYQTIVGNGTSASPWQNTLIYGTSQPFIGTGNTLTFIANGEFVFNYMIYGTGITAIAMPIVSVGSIASILGTVINAAGQWGIRIFKVRGARGAVITFGAPTLTTVTSTTVIISECDYDNLPLLA